MWRRTGLLLTSETAAAATAGTKLPTPLPRKNATGRKSGLQLEVLSLYRSLLRSCRRFDSSESRQELHQHIVAEFKKNQKIERKNLSMIEWHMQHGKRKLEDLETFKKDTKFQFSTFS